MTAVIVSCICHLSRTQCVILKTSYKTSSIKITFFCVRGNQFSCGKLPRTKVQDYSVEIYDWRLTQSNMIQMHALVDRRTTNVSWGHISNFQLLMNSYRCTFVSLRGEIVSMFLDMMMHANPPRMNSIMHMHHGVPLGIKSTHEHHFIGFRSTSVMPRHNAEQLNKAIGLHAGPASSPDKQLDTTIQRHQHNRWPSTPR